MIPAWDDVGQFIDPEDFGVWAVLSFQAGGTRQIPVLFDDPSHGLQFVRRTPIAPNTELGGYDMDADKPRIVATVANLAGVKRKDSIRVGTDKNGVGGTLYGVLTTPQPDGNGCATVVLVLES